MSRDGATAGVDREPTRRSESWPRAARAAVDLDREAVVVGAGAVALLSVAGRTGLRVLANLPFDPVAVPPPVRTLAATATPVVLALALIAVAAASVRPAARIGLLFAGAFGGLAAVAAAATLPAAAAVTGGGAVALVGAGGRPTGYRALRRQVVGLGLVAGVAAALGGSVGGLEGGFRNVGTLLTLGAVAAVGIRAEGDRVALASGLVALVAVVLASVTSPFVVGSALLVGFGVVGVPSLLVAAAAAGGTAAVVAGLRRRDPALAVGAALLLVAGAPGTVPRAMAAVLGATLALVGAGTLATPAAAGDGGEPA